jgi:hypothetical protein
MVVRSRSIPTRGTDHNDEKAQTHASVMAKGMLRLRADDRFAILAAPLSMTRESVPKAES